MEHGFAPERQRALKSVFRPMAASAATIKNLLASLSIEAAFAGIRPRLVRPDMARKPRMNHGKILEMLTFAADAPACSFFLICRLIAENASTAGMMDSVRVSLTMVAKSPAASLKA